MVDLNAASGWLRRVRAGYMGYWCSEHVGEGGYGLMEVNWLREVSTCVNPQNPAGEFPDAPSGPTALWLDNQSAIRVGKNPEHHSRMRHLLPKYHWLREQVEDKVSVLA